MKTVFGNKNLDGVIKVMLQGDSQVEEFLNSVPVRVMLGIKELVEKQTKGKRTYTFSNWDVTLEEGNFKLVREMDGSN